MTGYRELVRGNANFRKLWIGQIISLLGDWFNLIASASLVALLTESGFAVGSLFVIRLLAPFVTSPIAGVVADYFNRKRVLILCDILRAVVVLGFLLVRTPEQVWLLYTLTAAQLAVSGFFYPARTALLPDLVSKSELGTANALSSSTWSVMLAVGAALGGLVSGFLGIHWAFLIDSLTFLLSALVIVRIRAPRVSRVDQPMQTLGDGIRQYLEGISYLTRHKDVFVLSLHKAALGTLLGLGFDIVQIAATEEVFVIGIGGGVALGLLFSVEGAGTGIGPIVARHFSRDHEGHLKIAIFLGYLTGGLGLAIFAPLINFYLALFGMLIRGLGIGMVWVFSTQLLLMRVPSKVRGRVFATEFAFYTLAGAFGAALVGTLLDTGLGISGTSWLLAFLTLIPAGLWLAWILRFSTRCNRRGRRGVSV
jgi:MFS family permease